MALHSIELCAGVGMLGEGVRAAFELLGVEHRTVCYVERETAAAAQLATLMEAGALHTAPVWSDMLTFNGSAWRGLVDGVVAGFPCQDLSIAGRRAGLDGKRSGLFFRVLDIADDCGAWFLVLENVAGIATATATVVDEAEGELEERAAARVLGELADRGWNAEWVTLSASDVGASHGRARWFCLAWRRNVDHAGRLQWRAGHEQSRPGCTTPRGIETDNRATNGSCILGHCECPRWPQTWRGLAFNPGGESEPGRGALGNARLQHQHLQQWEIRSQPSTADSGLADSPGDGWHEGRPESIGEQGRSDVAECRGAMADANLNGMEERQWQVGQSTCTQGGKGGPEARRSCGALANTREPRLSHTEQPGEPGEPGEPQAYRRRTATQLRGAPLFAPGPADPIWRDLINAGRIGEWARIVGDDEADSCPWAPATEPGVRMLADGMAIVVDESRTHQLRQVGNGVVPLQAAAALVELVRRASEGQP